MTGAYCECIWDGVRESCDGGSGGSGRSCCGDMALAVRNMALGVGVVALAVGNMALRWDGSGVSICKLSLLKRVYEKCECSFNNVVAVF